MDDRGHNRHGTKRRGLLCPFRGELGLRVIQCGLSRGLLPYQVVSLPIQPFGHNRHEPKTGGSCAPFRGELRPHLTQRRLGRGLSPYQVACLSIHLFGHNRHGPKIGCALFLGVAIPIEHKVNWAEAYLHTKWHLSPSCRFATTDIGRKLGAVPL